MDEMQRQTAVIEDAKRFAEEKIRPSARRFDERGALDRDLIETLAEKRFLLAGLPEEYGGLGLDPLHYGLLTETIGKACCSTRGLITVQCSLAGETILKWGSEAQKRHWLPLMAKGRKIGAFALTEAEMLSFYRDCLLSRSLGNSPLSLKKVQNLE